LSTGSTALAQTKSLVPFLDATSLLDARSFVTPAWNAFSAPQRFELELSERGSANDEPPGRERVSSLHMVVGVLSINVTAAT